ncbi:ABC transporter permease [Actibacterium lipolyticum]|uniref:Uncharacterized protein n=1 Tax=Actibacterium lipolyticum TaxID=1524263 RepID=A0A238KP82_9RHOB|nr:ABC transporter permease [Actibacterium lipolyticum]SMX44441.1 hypothetical protein COL8621_02556 [Actibacterium lipolyticum]
MLELWHGFSATAQDVVTLCALALPIAALGVVLPRGFAPIPLIRAILWRFRWANALFVLLIAVSVGLGVALLAQERGLRAGTAAAADKFDLIIAAPGSEVTMMLASVYLQPADAGLLDGVTYASIATDARVAMAAPLAFGDSYQGAPIVGTTAEFVTHLAGPIAQGRIWGDHADAVIGADVPLAVGDGFEPAHGVGDVAEHDAHGEEFHVVGRLAPTGSPWDRAIIVPVETVWETHGLANGHRPEVAEQLGPPFDPEYFPGTPAVVVRATSIGATYGLKSSFARAGETMAFFPGSVLASLYAVMGDVRQAMSLMAVVTQILVAASVLLGLFILSQLFQRQMALLQALGAPRRFVLSVVWGYANTLVVAGAMLGLIIGFASVAILSDIVSERTGVRVVAEIGWSEFHLVAGFVSCVSLLSVVPGFAVLSRSIVSGLRA